MHVFDNANMYIWLCKDTGAMNRPLRLAECSQHISWADVALLIIRSQHYGRPQAAVGADSSCPHIRIRNAFAIRLKCLHGTFATCSFSVCYIFAMQKYGFCATKVWFLRHKSMVFGVQNPPFYIAKTPFLKYQNGVLNLEHIRQY